MRLLLVSAVLLLPAFSGCLGTVQDAFEFDDGPEDKPLSDEVELTYEVIPDEPGAYQFQVPEGVETLHFEPVADSLAVIGPVEEESGGMAARDKDDAAQFALFAASGSRVDLFRAQRANPAVELKRPVGGAYVFVAYEPLGHATKMTATSPRNNAPLLFSALVLPLTQYTYRVLLMERTPLASTEEEGQVSYPFPPISFGFSYVGIGTHFKGVVSSELGVVYEDQQDFPFGLPGDANGNSGFSPQYGSGTTVTHNLAGTNFGWTASTDFVGKVFLLAEAYQPAALVNFEIASQMVGVTDGVFASAGRFHPQDSLDVNNTSIRGEHFYAGKAGPGYEIFSFVYPSDGEALILEGAEDKCPDSASGSCGDRVSGVSLLSAGGQRLAFLTVRLGERLYITPLRPGEYALYVHSDMAVRVGVFGLPPADAHLHEEKLVRLISQPIFVSATTPSQEISIDFTGQPLRFELRQRCGTSRGSDFYAIIRFEKTVAYEFSSVSLPTYEAISGCFASIDRGKNVPEGLARTSLKVRIEASTGVGPMELLVWGIQSTDSHAGQNQGFCSSHPAGALRETEKVEAYPRNRVLPIPADGDDARDAVSTDVVANFTAFEPKRHEGRVCPEIAVHLAGAHAEVARQEAQ